MRFFPLAELDGGVEGESADALDECDTQHLGKRPELPDSKRSRRLVGVDECKNALRVQAQLQIGDELGGEIVDARETRGTSPRKGRELTVELRGEIDQDVTSVALDHVLVVENPLGSRRRSLLQPCGLRELGADSVDQPSGAVDPGEQIGGLPARGFDAVLNGQPLGVLADLRGRKRNAGFPRVRGG